MSCCGNRRASFAQQTWSNQYFQNIGVNPVVIQGPITGRIYRWKDKYEIREVDYRDLAAVRNHPTIRSYTQPRLS